MISATADSRSRVPRPLPVSPALLVLVTVVSEVVAPVPRPWSGLKAEPGGCGWVWADGAAVVAVGPAASAAGASPTASAKHVAIRKAERTTDRVAHRCETLGPDGPEVARTDARGAR